MIEWKYIWKCIRIFHISDHLFPADGANVFESSPLFRRTRNRKVRNGGRTLQTCHRARVGARKDEGGRDCGRLWSIMERRGTIEKREKMERRGKIERWGKMERRGNMGRGGRWKVGKNGMEIKINSREMVKNQLCGAEPRLQLEALDFGTIWGLV